MARQNSMKQRLRKGETLVGAFSTLHLPALVELLGLLGMDFVIVDGEHSGLTAETAEELYRAAELRRISCVTRIGENHPQVIQKFLDSGALSVMIPLVNTPEDARRAVDAVKYPPIGKRGLAASRASDWGLLPGGLAEHVKTSNQETFIAIQVETQQAVERFPEILAIEHVDLIFFGPSDLSSTLGLPGQTTHPEVLSRIERLGQQARAAGKATGTIARTAEEYHYWRERGFQWLCTGVNNLFASGVHHYLKGIKN
jgi:4-hydroxy-2-oxoheptanedioate aldolase